MPTKSAPTPPGLAQTCRVLQAPDCHSGPRRHRGDGVAERDDDDVGVGADEQAVAAGVDAGGRDGGEHQAARRGQRGDRPAGDRNVEGLRGAGHQRRGDVADQPVGAGRLRPGDGGGGLLDRQQRHQPAQHDARDARDDGDQPGDAVGRHEARW